MKHLLTILFIFCSLFSKGQNPLVKMWDKRFGGTSFEDLTCFQQTKDGGYILGGHSYSGIGGDKTQINWGLFDYWIVKIDSLGNKEWDKNFGGIDQDYLFSLQQTTDGGYILGGCSYSDISGDKTQANWDTSGVTSDYWIIKIDSLGNIQWDKDIGGINGDFLYSLQQTSDGGYILGGYSLSGISGDKTQAGWGSGDYWVIKTDSVGNKEWDKDFGGSSDEFLYSLQQTSDAGYFLGGFSYSGISGDKTQPTWGSFDFWVLKIDSLGNKQWDKDFGANQDEILKSMIQTFDGGYILAGSTASGIHGDKTEPSWGANDFWIVKIDSLGNKQWDKDMGGINGEVEIGNISQTTDSGYLVCGISYSDIGGDKSENNLGTEQTWMLKTNSIGIKQWDKTLRTTTTTDDEIGLAIQSFDGCIVAANYTQSDIGGDKTQSNRGFEDYWIIKFCDSTFLPPTATAFTDSLLCPGTCTNFTNVSTNAASYLWFFPGAAPDTSNDFNPTNICYANPGTYDVQLIATNANGSDTLLLVNYITVYPFPPSQSITQSGDTLFAIAGATSYQWYFNGNIISGATDYFYVAKASGDYNVVATDANGCEVEAAVFNVVASVNASEDQEILIFPNPVDDKVTIQKSHPDSYRDTRTATEISVYNVIGEKESIDIPSADKSNRDIEIDVHELSAGLYYIEIRSSEKTFRSKFVKQ